jgi:hypothetical protein
MFTKLPSGIILGALILLPSFFSLRNDLRSDGSFQNSVTLKLTVQFLVVTTFLISVDSACYSNRFILLFILLSILIIYGLFSYLLSSISFFETFHSLIIENIINSPFCLTLIIILSIFIFISQQIYDQLFLRSNYYPIMNAINKAILNEDWIFLRSVKDASEMIKMFRPADSLVAIYKRCFDEYSGKF